jgi:quinohemoprotein amine dehydrogenase
MRCWTAILLFCVIFAKVAFGQAHEEGIPVTDPLIIAKCTSCHARDERGNMQRISWERTTPEGWQEVLKRMILANGVEVTPPEARSIVAYLSATHGLAPEEAKPVLYDAERRIHPETNIPTENLRNACTTCHSFAHALSWRRSAEEWKQFVEMHAAQYGITGSEEAVTFLAKSAPLHTPEWDAWSARKADTPDLTGRWLLTASIPGRGKYFGQIQIDRAADGFNTSVLLTSVNDGSGILRAGRGVVYGNSAWRGRSKGGEPAGSAPDDLNSEAREVLWIAPDHSEAQGRWFWGQYQEFGFDVKLRRVSGDPTLLLLDRSSLKTGSEANRVRLIGDRFPAHVTPADLDFGPGITIGRVVSNTKTEVVAEVDVASDASLGKRDVSIFGSVAKGSLAIYDRIDYIKVTPESSLASFADQTHALGYQQFEAVGYQKGPDGKLHTADDLDLGPLPHDDVMWSMEVFYEAENHSTDFVGKVSSTGFFAPAAHSPGTNYDVWVIATTRNDKKPLVGKSYVVVTVPSYTFLGHRYVRDLDRWIDDGKADGPAQ